MKELIEKRLKELKERSAELERGIKQAENFLSINIPELNGAHGAIAEFEAILAAGDKQDKNS